MGTSTSSYIVSYNPRIDLWSAFRFQRSPPEAHVLRIGCRIGDAAVKRQPQKGKPCEALGPILTEVLLQILTRPRAEWPANKEPLPWCRGQLGAKEPQHITISIA